MTLWMNTIEKISNQRRRFLHERYSYFALFTAQGNFKSGFSTIFLSSLLIPNAGTTPSATDVHVADIQIFYKKKMEIIEL
jgi:hypothetical protein